MRGCETFNVVGSPTLPVLEIGVTCTTMSKGSCSWLEPSSQINVNSPGSLKSAGVIGSSVKRRSSNSPFTTSNMNPVSVGGSKAFKVMTPASEQECGFPSSLPRTISATSNSVRRGSIDPGPSTSNGSVVLANEHAQAGELKKTISIAIACFMLYPVNEKGEQRKRRDRDIVGPSLLFVLSLRGSPQR